MSDSRAADQWRAFVSELLPPGEARDLLLGIKVTPAAAAKPTDLILCSDSAMVPSEAVSCTFCGCSLWRSLQASKAPRPICLSCLDTMTRNEQA